MDRKLYNLMLLIDKHFHENKHLGNVLTISDIDSPEESIYFHVTCFDGMEYIVRLKDDKICNISVKSIDLM